MIILKTTEDIFKHASSGLQVLSQDLAPPKEHLPNNQFKPDISNVKVWEEIYYKKHYAGIYAAWSPYVEFYIIVYELFLDTDYSYEAFFGKDCTKELIDRAKKLGINLEERFIWVDDLDYKNFTDI